MLNLPVASIVIILHLTPADIWTVYKGWQYFCRPNYLYMQFSAAGVTWDRSSAHTPVKQGTNKMGGSGDVWCILIHHSSITHHGKQSQDLMVIGQDLPWTQLTSSLAQPRWRAQFWGTCRDLYITLKIRAIDQLLRLPWKCFLHI